LVIALSLVLQACDPITGDEPGPATYGAVSDETLGTSLIFAALEICIPYVVDGASEANLTRRPGVTERRYYVHGQRVTAYELDQPGSPRVLLYRYDGQVDDCRIDLATRSWSNRLAIIDVFRRGVRLGTRHWSDPHNVEKPHVLDEKEIRRGGGPIACVHGNADALLYVSNPDPQYPLTVSILENSNVCSRTTAYE
jgi:hypothetical protein